MRDRDLNLLQETYKNVLLNEMPHIEFTLNDKDFFYDMTVELFPIDWNGMVNQLKKFLDNFGKARNLAKIKFFQELKKHIAIQNGILQKVYGKTVDDLESEV